MKAMKNMLFVQIGKQIIIPPPHLYFFKNNFIFSQIRIKESVILLHEAYCSRNRIKCFKCGSFIEKNELSDHETNYHSTVFSSIFDVSFKKIKKFQKIDNL